MDEIRKYKTAIVIVAIDSIDFFAVEGINKKKFGLDQCGVVWSGVVWIISFLSIHANLL